MYRTVIIEDDPVITQLNRQYVEKDSRFTVVQTFSAAHPALFWLRNNLVDLIILDMYMPQMSGLELLRILRAEGVNADVIMVTSADDAATIESFIRLGVTDYLIKPFGYERFQLALKNFCDHWDTIHQDPNHPTSSPRTSWTTSCSTSPPPLPHRLPAACPRGCRARPSPSSRTTSKRTPKATPVMTLPATWACPWSPCAGT